MKLEINPVCVLETADSKNKNTKRCKRGHDASMNWQILGTKKRFCMHIMEDSVELTKGGIRGKKCGDIPL